MYYKATTFDADVDHIDFGEEVQSKSEDALNNHNTDQISITLSETEDKTTETTSDLSVVHSKSTEAEDSE